jgi:predicted TPR repeat methyltransferase
MRRAVELQPGNASYRCTLGEALEASKRPADAIREFLAAWRLAPERPGAYDRLIVTCMREGRLEEGVEYFQEALARDPQLRDSCRHLDPALARIILPPNARPAGETDLPIDPLVLVACHAYGQAADRLGNVPESSRACRNHKILDTSCGPVYFSLFHILNQRGRYNEALACVRAVAALEPQNATAHHLIAALSGESLDRASPQYCESLFDDYAARFDAHLVDRLGYAAPQQLAELALAIAQPPPSGWDILDLGCGTGLVGVAFTSAARNLVGVDLSGAMLEHAKKRQVYSRLEKTDLEQFLRSEDAPSYDLIVAADVFTYLGRLDSVFEDLKRLLRVRGLAAFSVEALEAASIASLSPSADYALSKAGRFAQSHAYVERLSATYGFVIERCVETILRTEHGTPSTGRLYVVRLPSKSASPQVMQQGTEANESSRTP